MKKSIIVSVVAFFVFTAIAVFWSVKEIRKQEREHRQEVVQQENAKTQAGELEPNEELEEIDTSSWKTYRNEEYGFEIKYPEKSFLYEKIIKNSEIINSLTQNIYIADEFKQETLNGKDDTIFHSITLQFFSAEARIVPKMFIVDKNIQSIMCPNNSTKPCFEKDYLRKIKINDRDAYIKKDPHRITIYLRDAPVSWSDYNMIVFSNAASGNQTIEMNIKIMKIFEEMLSTIRFLE